MANRWILILFCLVVMMWACDDDEARRQAVIDQGVQIKIEQYTLRQEAICKREAVDKAVAIADSIMRVQGPKTARQQVGKPPPAIKPVMPPVKQLPDSLRNNPLQKEN